MLQKIQNVPALNAKQTCTYRVDKGILKEASCQENHDLLAFRSSTGGGISANIAVKLTYAQEGPAAALAGSGNILILLIQHFHRHHLL